MELWLERFASDLVRSPKRVKKIVETLIKDTGCSEEQAARIRKAAEKYSITEETFSEKKTLAKHVSVQVEKLEELKGEMLRFMASSNREILRKMIK